MNKKKGGAENTRLVLIQRQGRSTRWLGERSVLVIVSSFVVLSVVVFSFAISQSRSRRGIENAESSTTATNLPISKNQFDVLRIIDGDTIVIIGRDLIEHRLRIGGIDAPELEQEFGLEATAFVRNMVDGKNILLDNISRGKYGRLVADVYVDSRLVALEMVQNGFAWVYPISESRVLRDAEQTARENKTGLWSKKDAVPPWTWRGER